MTEPERETPSQLIRRAIAESFVGRTGSALRSAIALEAVLALLVGASGFLAALPALHAYRVPAAAAVVLSAAAGSTAVAWAAVRVFRFSPALSYAFSLIGLIIVLLAADGPHPGQVATAIARGPNRILTETLPLSGGRMAISALVVLVWVATAATAEILLRRADRSRGPLALGLPVVLYVLCFAVASSAPGPDRIGGPLLLVAVSLAAALHLQLATPVEEDQGPDAAPPSRARVATTGVLSAAAVAAVLAGLAPTIPALRTAPAQLHRRPPTATPLITDPVDSMGQLRDGHPHAPPTTELSVSLSAPSSGYLAMGYVDVYDGGQWRFSATFQPTGGRIPAAAPVTSLVSNHSVVQRFDVTGVLPIGLLPALDRPVSVTGLPVVSDATTGMLLPQSEKAKRAYTVLSESPDATLLGIPSADGIGPDPNAADLQLPPDTSSDIATAARFLSTLANGAKPTPTVSFLQAALQALQTGEKRIDPSVPNSGGSPAGKPSVTTTTSPSEGGGGTSLSEVINAVTVDRSATPEQFATFYAMVARYLGVPARVVTGFRLAGDPSGRPVPAGTYRVTNRQAWAWAEVPVSGMGWVVCDPTPVATTAAPTAPPESLSAPSTTVPPRQADAVPRSQSVGGHPLAPSAHTGSHRGGSNSLWIYLVCGFGGLLLLAALGGPGQAALRRRLRRRRRMSADPSVLAVGAWLELLDGLDRAGMRPRAGATASEVAGEVGHHFGAELVPQAAAVAATADRAVFSTTSPVPTDAALEAWRTSQEICRRVQSGLDTRQRIRWAVSVGSAPSRPAGSARSLQPGRSSAAGR